MTGKVHLALHKQFSLLRKLLPKDSASTKATFTLQLKKKNIKLSVLSCILKVSTAKYNFPHIRQLNCRKMSSCCRSSTCARGRTSSQYLPTRFNATQNLHASWTRNKFCCYPGTDINTLSIPLPPWTSASPPPPSSQAGVDPGAAASTCRPTKTHSSLSPPPHLICLLVNDLLRFPQEVVAELLQLFFTLMAGLFHT